MDSIKDGDHLELEITPVGATSKVIVNSEMLKDAYAATLYLRAGEVTRLVVEEWSPFPERKTYSGYFVTDEEYVQWRKYDNARPRTVPTDSGLNHS